MTAAEEQGDTEDGVLPRLIEKLDASDLSNVAQCAVLAAYQGDDDLAQLLDDVASAERVAPTAVASRDVPETWLGKITVAGFRGIGPETSLTLHPGTGLTLVVGRNGSGKSSFAEAAEVALTGSNARWAGDRGAIWRTGWQNLHRGDVQPSVAVELVVTGRGVTTVTRTWPGDDVTQSEVRVARPGARHERELGWDDALVAYRPFLSYAELGAMLTGRPSEMYDAMARILGLQQVADAQNRLKGVTDQLKAQAKRLKDDRVELLRVLDESLDERAGQVAAGLRARTPHLAQLRELLREETGPDGDLAPLRAWRDVTGPDAPAALLVADQLEAAVAAWADLSDGDSEAARRLADLLAAALEHATHVADADCPVCGAPERLDKAWRTATQREIARLREVAQAADTARRHLAQARQAAVDVARAPSSAMPQPPGEVASGDLLQRWRAWALAVRSAEPATAVAVLRDDSQGLAEEIDHASATARDELRRREDLWQPLAQRLREHVAAAEEIDQRAELRVDLQAAAAWLRVQADVLRNEGLEPLAARAAEIWADLRQKSNVNVGPVRLEGERTRRRVTLDVTVDGEGGAALGVMSQGELHALGLALFLPRATLDESPFRFVVIDDPVQAMDPAKVDGLAEALSKVAETRQVVVFTHDDRLPEAVRRLQKSATIWDVVRGERSFVQVRSSGDPVSRCLEDARAVALTEALRGEVQSRVVPGLCRQAVEALCHEMTRRRNLRRGDRYADIEAAITACQGTDATMKLALWDDSRSPNEVKRFLDRQLHPVAATAFRAVNEGAHQGYTGNMIGLVEDVQKLVRGLRAAYPEGVRG